MASGRWPTEVLEGPPFPEALRYLWGWWQELELGRTWREGSPSAVTFAEVRAWSELTGTELRPDEAVALVEIDRTWRFPGRLKEEDLGDPGAGGDEDESIWPEGWRD